MVVAHRFTFLALLPVVTGSLYTLPLAELIRMYDSSRIKLLGGASEKKSTGPTEAALRNRSR